MEYPKHMGNKPKDFVHYLSLLNFMILKHKTSRTVIVQNIWETRQRFCALFTAFYCARFFWAICQDIKATKQTEYAV